MKPNLLFMRIKLFPFQAHYQAHHAYTELLAIEVIGNQQVVLLNTSNFILQPIQ